jgi:hypothetical protein
MKSIKPNWKDRSKGLNNNSIKNESHLSSELSTPEVDEGKAELATDTTEQVTVIALHETTQIDLKEGSDIDESQMSSARSIPEVELGKTELVSEIEQILLKIAKII